MSVGAKNCQKNVLIGFVDDISKEVDNLLENERWAFGNLQPSERKKLVNQSGPTRAWHVSKMGNADGVELVWRESSEISGLYIYEDRSNTTGSRLRSSRTQLIKASVVLIERSSAVGKTLNQLTDFATFRAIAPVDVIQESPPPSPASILTLFDSASAPEELTDFDTAFLKAYYAGNGRNLYLNSTIQSVGLEFSRRLESKDGEAE